jgi:hypothetical protein
VSYGSKIIFKDRKRLNSLKVGRRRKRSRRRRILLCKEIKYKTSLLKG